MSTETKCPRKQKYILLKIKKIEKKIFKYSHLFNEEISSLNRNPFGTNAKNIKT